MTIRYNGFDLVDLKKAIKSQGEFAEEPMLGLLYLLKTMIRQEPLADLVMTRQSLWCCQVRLLPCCSVVSLGLCLFIRVRRLV